MSASVAFAFYAEEFTKYISLVGNEGSEVFISLGGSSLGFQELSVSTIETGISRMLTATMYTGVAIMVGSSALFSLGLVGSVSGVIMSAIIMIVGITCSGTIVNVVSNILEST